MIDDYLMISISKEEVQAEEFGNVLATLNSFLESPETAKRFRENVDLGFSGYDDDRRELFEIIEVRNYIRRLDEKFPYWLFFLSKFGTGLQCIFLAMMPPHLNQKGKESVFPERLNTLLTNRWFPAMNSVCTFVKMDETDIKRLSERAVSYLTEGVFRL